MLKANFSFTFSESQWRSGCRYLCWKNK